MYAQTVAIADPGDLRSYFPAHQGLSWLRNGDGMIGIGEFAHFSPADDSTSIATTAELAEAAEVWWRDQTDGFEIQNELPQVFGTGPLAFGSLVFDPNNSQERSVLIIPRLIIGKRKGQSWLTLISEEPTQPTLPLAHRKPTPPVPTGITPVGLADDEWCAAVKAALAHLDGELTKVVLARGIKLHTTDPIDAAWIVNWLAEQYPTCWTYHSRGLVGATPEMLVRREHGLVTSRVLAGTIRRNGGEELDLKLAHALARSSKNLIEHELAVDSVANALSDFVWGMNVPERPFVLELPNVLHLASDVTASVHEDASALRLAGALHPSAAVCGTPTALARTTIAELEHFDRGRYSGPVGWIDAAGDGEFAIALRCGQISATDPATITLYAGCGIVDGSDPDDEYAETEAKLLPMLQAMGL